MIQRTEYDPKVIGRNLRRLRERKNLTVEQVRQYLCLGSVQAIYKYETGVGYPQADTMLALMELYEATVNEIVNIYEEEQSSSFGFNRFIFKTIYCYCRNRVYDSAEYSTDFCKIFLKVTPVAVPLCEKRA